ESNFRVLFRSFKKNKLALISLIFVCLLFLVVIFGPWLTPYDPQEADYENLLSGPSLEHLAGTDEFGKDVLSRLIVGARLSLRSEEHTSELQSRFDLVCRLLLEKKKKTK